MRLTEQQHKFMQVFGYLAFPGLLSDRIHAVCDAFDAVFESHGGGHNGKPHDGNARSCIVPFIDQSEYLSSLLDDPCIDGIFTSLLGTDYNYLGSDGNFYVGDTRWHSDADWSGNMRGAPPRNFFKMAFYLDPLTAGTGALRVVPGSHRWGDGFADDLHAAVGDASETLGIRGDQMPAMALETQPGDVVVFNQCTKHSAWGGGTRRRMFTINCTAHYEADEIPLLRNEISGFARLWVDSVYGQAMLQSASQHRMVHLQQALDHQDHLAEEVRKARAAMSEPSRG